MKKLYNSKDLRRDENHTPHFHFTWAGLIIPSIIAVFVLGIIILWAKYA